VGKKEQARKMGTQESGEGNGVPKVPIEAGDRCSARTSRYRGGKREDFKKKAENKVPPGGRSFFPVPKQEQEGGEEISPWEKCLTKGRGRCESKGLDTWN